METQKEEEENPNDPELATEGDIQMEFSSVSCTPQVYK
jgi:hypothetical protein